jgi:hypothetical protein
MKKVLLVVVVVLLTVAFFAYRYYNKPHRSLEDEAGIAVDASSLFQAFESNETEANALYLDKVIMVNGKVSSLSINQEGKQVVILETADPMFGVSCTLEEPLVDIEIGTTIAIKGFCKGYLSDVVLTECKLAK